MTTPHRATGAFLPDEEFVDGLIGLGVTLGRGAAIVESLSGDEGPALVRGDHPLVLLLLGVVGLHRAARSAVGDALSPPPETEAPPPLNDGRGLLR